MKCFLFGLMALSLFACSSLVKAPEKIVSQKFPMIVGNSLAGGQVEIPNAYQGKSTLLLVGYLQRAQFDIDRWILGALQAELPVTIVEIPTIAGMAPQVVQSFIDNGMRSGIPKEDWASVVTVYEDAEKIIAAIGNENRQNAHAVLLSEDGTIEWISNRGYSASQVLELKEKLAMRE